MKKLVFLFCFIVSMLSAFSQSASVDSMLTKINEEKNGNVRFDIISDFFSNTADYDPLLDLKNAQKLLSHSQKSHDKISEAFGLSQIGYDYRQFGNRAKSLEYGLKSEKIAEEAKNDKLTVYVKTALGLVYRDLGMNLKAIDLLKSVEGLATKEKYDKGMEGILQNLSEVYLAMNQIDSALMYAQKDYELSMRIHYLEWIGYTYLNLGAIHGRIGNEKLAISYYDMAIEHGVKTRSVRQLSSAYASKAEYLYDTNQNDSSIIYAKNAVDIVQHTPFANYSLSPAKLLLSIYRNNNIDSAFKYSEIYRIANDSLFNAKAIQETQLMTFEDEQHQQELLAEKLRIEEERHQNIQYAVIALGIIIFITLFLLLSRTVIVNERLISFFAILGLLVVFEFINLLIHPWLAHFTHESPVLMLLALVLIASLLIPLHHKLEHWIKEKMIEKNKAVRLTAAKKTIEKLG